LLPFKFKHIFSNTCTNNVQLENLHTEHCNAQKIANDKSDEYEQLTNAVMEQNKKMTVTWPPKFDSIITVISNYTVKQQNTPITKTHYNVTTNHPEPSFKRLYQESTASSQNFPFSETILPVPLLAFKHHSLVSIHTQLLCFMGFMKASAGGGHPQLASNYNCTSTPCSSLT